MSDDKDLSPDNPGIGDHEETPRGLPSGITILATQAFCPNGHNLVMRKDVLFGGHPGISLHVETEEWKGEIVLSPYQGDPTKAGDIPKIPEGTRVQVKCPVCGVNLPVQTRCGCSGNGDLVALYLTRNAERGDMIMLCDVWGCHRSRVMDNWQVISEFADLEGDE